ALGLCFHAAGLAFRYATGAYASPSALRYALESPTQLGAQLLDSYPSAPWLCALGLLGAWGLVAAGAAVAQRRLAGRRLSLPSCAACVGAAALALPPTPSLLVAQDAETVEVALYASALAARRDAQVLAGRPVDEGLAGPLQAE